VQSGGDEVTEDALGPVADHRTTDRLGDNKADPSFPVNGRHRIPAGDDQQPATGTRGTGSTQCGGEVRGRPQPVTCGEHAALTRRLRLTAQSGPCGGERPGSRDPPGCAFAGGSRGSWPDGGCSAERCACSRGVSVAARRTVDAFRPVGSRLSSRRGVRARFGRHREPGSSSVGDNQRVTGKRKGPRNRVSLRYGSVEERVKLGTRLAQAGSRSDQPNGSRFPRGNASCAPKRSSLRPIAASLDATRRAVEEFPPQRPVRTLRMLSRCC
jgi:hypothetical protein